MMHLNFYDLLSKFTCIPLPIQAYFNGIMPETTPLDIDLLWDKIIDRFKLLFPLYKTEQINDFKLDILLSLYTSARFTMAEAIDTGEIAKAYIEYDPASCSIFYTPDSIRPTLALVKQQLKQLCGAFLAGQYFDSTTLQYFSAYANQTSIKVFSELDFFNYLKEYKHWPYFLDNQYGMTVTELYDSYHRIQDSIQLKDNNAENSFQANFSAYIFEELFHPIKFSNLLTNYFKYFSDIFYESGPSETIAIREKVLSQLIPFFQLPFSIQERMSSDYCLALAEYVHSKDESEKKLRYYQQLNSALLQAYYLFPLLQITFCKTLFTASDQNLKSIVSQLEEYLSTSKLHFHEDISTHLNQVKDLYYPNKPSKEKPITNSSNPVWITNKEKDGQKGRNNIAIQSFQINSTYSFFYQPRRLNVIEQCMLPNCPWNPPYYLEIMQNAILNPYPGGFSGADATWNYLHYLRDKNNDHYNF